MPQLPMPLRAALGAVATVVDEARALPDRAVELPMRAVSTAMKVGFQAQQRYAALAARGDELIGGHRTTDEPPAWATFDEDVTDAGFDPSSFGGAVQEDFADLDSATPDELAADDEPDVQSSPDSDIDATATVNGAAPAQNAATQNGATQNGAAHKTVRAPRTGPSSAFDDVEE